MRAPRRPDRAGERGAVLTAALISAFLASIASYLVLQIAVSQSRHARFHEEHAVARHAAEAGVVWAYDRLIYETMGGGPVYCGGDSLTINGMTVDVTVSGCPGPRALTAKVHY
ncbi:MAG: hypothetical protein HYT90_01270 [Candidatus Omnitrophica bacterium]|nr:hypothetical protein [Candidatus Omnitrophota bacterium]